MHIILQARPHVLVLNGIKYKVKRVFVDSQVDDKFQDKWHHIYNTPFDFDVKIITIFRWLGLKIFAIACADVIGEVSNNLVVVVDFLFGELGLGLVSDDIEVFLFLFVLVHFYLLYVLERF